MKKIIIFTFLFASSTSMAAPSCKEKLIKVVNELDRAYVRIIGVAQGDYEQPPLEFKHLKSTKVSDATHDEYRVIADHMNDEGETWKDTYEITLSNPGCYLSTYKFLGSK